MAIVLASELVLAEELALVHAAALPRVLAAAARALPLALDGVGRVQPPVEVRQPIDHRVRLLRHGPLFDLLLFDQRHCEHEGLLLALL